MHGIKHGICVVFCSHLDAAKQLPCSIRTTQSRNIPQYYTEKSIRLFTDVAIREVTWYMIKQKDDATKQLYYPVQTNIHGVNNNKNIRPILGTLCVIIR
jgi:hypothetical protein